MIEMYSERAPGNTCMSSLSSGLCGSLAYPINDSAGCGGVMRVAPIGFINSFITFDSIMKLGAESTAITHGNPRAYLPSALMSAIIHNIIYNQDNELDTIIMDSLVSMTMAFNNDPGIEDFYNLIMKSIKLAHNNKPDEPNISEIGQGWVGDEALAIAIYTSMRYYDSFDDCIIAAVNHSGDSDSTGAIAGNIVGAYLGISNIDDKWINNVELLDILDTMSNDLYNANNTENKSWKKRYIM